jgi:hypothetical protein
MLLCPHYSRYVLIVHSVEHSLFDGLLCCMSIDLVMILQALHVLYGVASRYNRMFFYAYMRCNMLYGMER